MKRALPYLLPTLGSVLLAALISGVYAMGPKMLNIDGDLGRHLTIGAFILDSGSIPTTDLFSHTMPGEALTPHEWLSQVLFALSYRLLGLSGPVLLAALCISIALWLIYRAALAKSGSLLAALICAVIGMAASSLHWLTRPHIFTFLLLAIWLVGLEQMRRGQTSRLRGWMWMPILMLAWANLHGAFIAGFAVWGLYGLAYVWDRWIERQRADFAPGFGLSFLLCGGLSAAATLLNPDGTGLWQTSLGYLGSQYLVGHTAEYLSPDFHQPAFWPFLLMLLLGLGLFGLSGRRRRTVDVLLFGAWGAMALVSARNIPLFVLAALPVLAEALVETVEVFGRQVKFFAALRSFDLRLLAVEEQARGFVWPAAAVLAAVALTAGGAGRDANRFDARVFPAAAVDWMEANPQRDEGFNYFPWGGYLLYRLWPETRVFIDGQTDFYGEALTREYEQVISVQPGWEQVLDRYAVGWVLIPVDQALARELSRRDAWSEVYRDGTAVIYQRSGLGP